MTKNSAAVEIKDWDEAFDALVWMKNKHIDLLKGEKPTSINIIVDVYVGKEEEAKIKT